MMELKARYIDMKKYVEFTLIDGNVEIKSGLLSKAEAQEFLAQFIGCVDDVQDMRGEA
jgi:hypothetical protein